MRPLSTRFITLFAFLISSVAFGSLAAAQESESEPSIASAPIVVKAWAPILRTKITPPAFHAESEPDWKTANWFDQHLLDIERAARGLEIGPLRFEGEAPGPRRERIIGADPLGLAEAEDSAAAELAVFKHEWTATRFTRAKLTLRSHDLLRVYLNGQKVGQKSKAEDAGKERGSLDIELTLPQGQHVIMLVALREPGKRPAWKIDAELTEKDLGDRRPALAARITGARVAKDRLDIDLLLDSPRLQNMEISPDGQWVASTELNPVVSGPDQEKRVLIRNTMFGLEHSLEGASNFAWSPTFHRRATPASGAKFPLTPSPSAFAYTTTEDGKTSLWIGNTTGRTRRVIEDDENLVGFHWLADQMPMLLLSRQAKSKAEQRGVKRFRNLGDRSSASRARHRIDAFDPETGSRRLLVRGKTSLTIHDVSRDGKRFLFSRPDVDFTERPFARTILYEMTLADQTTRELARTSWFRGASYAPSGDKICVLSGASSFEGVGKNLAPGIIPNEYDVQAFLLDLESLAVDPITRDFNPSVDEARWSHADGRLYMRVVEGSYRRLYAYDPKERVFADIAVDFDCVEAFSVARGRALTAVLGSGTRHTRAAMILDQRKQERKISTPYAEAMKAVKLGEVKDLPVKLADDEVLQGRVYYPPDYDPSQSYPAIVYYYGGTVPTTREFGGRYPKHLWAAKGYLVYVVQPSGAIGYGQEFSARHVNNWGKTVVDEIIAGTTRFLEEHKNVDRKRVGCIGASYGGFMTMLLQTRTDLFRTGIAHAGISSLASYWGEGNWGYLYSAVASAESYPWNAKDLYIDQSALFRADKFSGSLLLLHGASDTNVPKGESDQMFTALKILGKPVEYLQFEGEDHWILKDERRKLWMQSIIAWFDRELKGEPAYWDWLYAEDKAH